MEAWQELQRVGEGGVPRGRGLVCIAESLWTLAKVICRTHWPKNVCGHGAAGRRPVDGVSVLPRSRNCTPFWPAIVSSMLNSSLAHSRHSINISDIQEHPRVSLPSVSSGIAQPGLAQRWRRVLWFML